MPVTLVSLWTKIFLAIKTPTHPEIRDTPTIPYTGSHFMISSSPPSATLFISYAMRNPSVPSRKTSSTTLITNLVLSCFTSFFTLLRSLQ